LSSVEQLVEELVEHPHTEKLTVHQLQCGPRTRMTSTRSLLVLLTLLALPLAARADDVAKAREHFKRGSTLYYLQRYVEAAAEYEKTYELREDPSLLYNIGQAYRLGGEQQKAIGAYRSYLARTPNAPNRVAVLALIEDCKKTLEAQKATREKPPTGTLPDGEKPGETAAKTTPVTPPPVAPPPAHINDTQPAPAPVAAKKGPSPRTIKLAGLGVGAFGVASLAVGATFLGLTLAANSTLNHNNGGPFDQALYHRAQTYQLLDQVFLSVGGAALVAGVVTYVLGVRSSRVQVVPSLGRDRAGASIGLSF
jgi:tetratricopeptide (TPR) repeat protein